MSLENFVHTVRFFNGMLRCKGFTQRGTRCKKAARLDTATGQIGDFCGQHEGVFNFYTAADYYLFGCTACTNCGEPRKVLREPFRVFRLCFKCRYEGN